MTKQRIIRVNAATTEHLRTPATVVGSPAIRLASPQTTSDAGGLRQEEALYRVWTRGLEDTAAVLEKFEQDDMELNIANAVSMLPPSPPNTLTEFLDSVVTGELIPAMCHPNTRIDTGRFWGNRRVQNSLRRLLEALEERFRCEDDSLGS